MPKFSQIALYQLIRRFFIPIFRKEVFEMEFLKTLFASGALSWEQFQAAAQQAGFEVVNAAGGAYVPKADLDAKAAELETANGTIGSLRAAAKAWDGKDPAKLEGDLKALQEKYDADTARIRRDAAIDLALTRARARDAVIARAALDLNAVKLDKEGRVTGLDSQLETLKRDKAWLFEDTSPAGKDAGGKPPYAPPAGGKPGTVNDLAGALAEHYTN